MKKNTEMLLTNLILRVQSHSIALTNFLFFFRKRQNFLSKVQILIAFIFAFALNFCTGIPAFASTKSVEYVYRSADSNGNVVSEDRTANCTALASSTAPSSVVLDDSESKWYYTNSRTINVANNLTVSGDVNLILVNGYTLTVNKGIYVTKGSSLTIYGQTGDKGKLIATGDGGYAGIGSPTSTAGSIAITIHGGNIEATGGIAAAGIGGAFTGNSITIYGGTVTATGGDRAAGIGGDRAAGNSTISIYGGEITATGGQNGAGIGGGLSDGSGASLSSGTINIYGGNIAAKGGKYENVSSLTCSPEYYAAGIGDGSRFANCAVNIYGGNITASSYGGENSYGVRDGYGIRGQITLSYKNANDSIYATNYGGSVTVADGKPFIVSGDGTEISGTVGVVKVEKTLSLSTETVTVDTCPTLDGKTLIPPSYNVNVETNNITANTAKAFPGETVTLSPAAGYNLTAVNVNGSAITGNTFTMPAEDVTVTGTTTLITYTITYNLNGGTVTTTNPATYTVETETFMLTNPTKTGYTFEGWSTFVGGVKVMNMSVKKGSTGDNTYIANWSLITYSISCELNGGNLSEANPTSYTIESADITLKNPTRDGYTFAGWTGTGLNAKTQVVTIQQGSTENKTFTANWTAQEYKISFDLKGGTLATANPASYTVESENITLKNPTRTGYKFTGWTGTGIADTSTSVTIPKGSTGKREYTANWSLITYTISYDLKGGNLSAANPASYTIESAAFSLNNPTKNGYNFTGWTGSNGTNPETSVTIQQGSTENKNFTANWSLITYTISYDLKDGNLSMANPASYTVESAAFSLNNPIKNGYTFDGWSGTGLTANTETVTIANGSTGNKTFTANWTPITYPITYELNGGTNNADNPGGYTVEDSIALKAPVKDGHKFTGWTGSNGSEPQTSVTIQQGSTENKNFTANWTVQEYKISFDLNGGKLGTDQGNPTSYDINSENFSPANPTREGYEFEGWLLSGDTTGAVSKDLTVPNGSTGDREYIAQWKAIKYSISYGLDGGTVSPDNPASYTAESADIKLTNPTRNGYDFTGWSFDAKISLDVTIPKGSTGDKNFSAIWSLITYPISYDLNGGNLSTANPTGYTIESNAITLNNPSRNGYQFDGWTGTNLTAKTQTVTIANGSTGNRSYIANFTPIKYAITYNLDGGTNNSGNPAEYTVEDLITLKDPTKTGYDFNGWTPEGTINKGSTGNKTFTANWTAQKGGENPEPEPDKPDDPDKPDPDDPEPETVADAEEISSMTSDELKKNFGNTTEIALTGEIKNFEEVLEKLADAGVKVETLDLSNAKLEEVKIPENSPVSSINLKGNTSVKEVDVSGSKNLQTLDLTGSTVTKVEAQGCEKLSEVKVEKAEKLTSIAVSETPITSLNVKDCSNLEKIDAKGCENLEEVNLEGCESLKELDVSQTSVVSLNAQNCTNLETLNCASCDIKNLDIEGCKNLKIIDCSGNSLTRFDASRARFGALQKLSCGNQHVKGFMRTRYFNILDLLFMRLMNISTADENENDTGDAANVKDVKAFDGNGNEISVTFDDETGEVTFSQEPAEIRYNYITGFNDIKMDVTVSASDSSEGEIDESNESGGGCNSVRSNELGVRSVLILALLALAFAFGKKPGFKKP